MAQYKLIVIVLLLNLFLVPVRFDLLPSPRLFPWLFASPETDPNKILRISGGSIKRKPAVKGKEWRTITYNMNQYLFDPGLGNTPYRFS
ncbi:CFF_collapsed_G0000810.mRNA.1.CDS.1 [Saccharomyces cerevisiae]|nr:CFF_collapsed_G0000810.mRNA.1.CDS.1 [Saccharomyces cerevisiae]